MRASRSVEYDVRLNPDLFHPDNETLEAQVFCGTARRRLFVVEQTVFELYGSRLAEYLKRRHLPVRMLVVAADERAKELSLALRIIAEMDELGIDRRREPVVAIGGGVLLDVVGWAASVFRRGVPFIKIPTTLLAIVDAGVGVKTGINHNGSKNQLGSYHPPVLALLDPTFVGTLPRRHISSGLAEIAKIGLVCDSRLWTLLADHSEDFTGAAFRGDDPEFDPVVREVLGRAVHGMLAELQPNLWEHQLHRLVDFGHTFSPAVEMAALPHLMHGEAVALDMALSCVLAAERGLLDWRQLPGILSTLVRLGLPLTHPAQTVEAVGKGLAESVVHRGGQQRIPVPVRPGQAVFLDDVTVPELATALRRLAVLAEPAEMATAMWGSDATC